MLHDLFVATEYFTKKVTCLEFHCIGLCDKVLVGKSGEWDYRGGFCKKKSEDAPVLEGVNSTGSKMNLPLTKAEPINNSGSAPVISLRKGKSFCEAAAGREA